jgi:hypothetical protein
MGQGQLLKAPATMASATREQLQKWRELRGKLRAFDLDDSSAAGRVALLYVDGPLKPQVAKP